MVFGSPWFSFAYSPDDSFRRLARMDGVATVADIDPDHHQSAARRCPPDHLMRLASGNLGLDATEVVKRLFNFHNRNVPFGMIGPEVLAIGIVPDDGPIVPPLSIYILGGQKGG